MDAERIQQLAAAAQAAHDRIDVLERREKAPIAVIGMGCRLPGGVDSPEMLWSMLETGCDAVTTIPDERRDLAGALGDDGFDDPSMAPVHGAFVDGIDAFEPAFFGISEREAVRMDPQQRMLLEVSWQTIENAGIRPTDLRGSSTGLYVGSCFEDFARRRGSALDVASSLGSSRSVGVGRVAYSLDLHGPVLQLDTTCSSSLLAVHLAAHALRRGECDLALAGGVNAMLTHEVFLAFQQMGALSRSGRCRTFDANADGYVRGEGCALVALKLLSRAEEDGDPIWAVIEGSAVNHDGRSNGLTAPNGAAQEAVIRAALDNAGRRGEEVEYLELHGTGTPLGDPIEAAAALRAFGEDRGAERPLYTGSIKTNIGHLEGAAGVAGLMRSALAIHRRCIPPSCHFQTPSERIDWTTLRTPTAPVPWTGSNRHAGVSSFGMSGTNVHVVLGPAPERTPAPRRSTAGPAVLVVSARTPASLRQIAGRYAEALERPEGPSLEDLCRTAHDGRVRFEHAMTFRADHASAMASALRAFSSGGAPSASTPGAPDEALDTTAGRRVSIPPYQFDRRRFWPGDDRPGSTMEDRAGIVSPPPASSTPAMTSGSPDRDVTLLEGRLLEAIAAATDRPIESIDPMLPLGELGIDSLAAADVLITMEREVGRALPDSLIQQTSTIRDLAEMIAAGADVGGAPPAST